MKPQVSASAFGTWRAGARPDAAERARFAGQLREEALLVQPFVPDVAAVGEWSLVFLGGAYSHAVLKRPAAGDFRVQYELSGTFAPAAPPAASDATTERPPRGGPDPNSDTLEPHE